MDRPVFDSACSACRAFTAAGGQLWLSAEVQAIHVGNGQVTGATVCRADGEQGAVTAQVVVSDAGPAATIRLIGPDQLPPEYLTAVKARDRPCAMITVNFASRDRLMEAPGLLSFASTRRLCYAANFTDVCPEMAPRGWHLYAGTAVPRPSVGDFDTAAETDLLMADLQAELPGFEKARILSTVVTRDDWPPQRAVAGYDLPPSTPIPNLWNVGDGVKEYANGGTTACAETAHLVATAIMSQFPAESGRAAG